LNLIGFWNLQISDKPDLWDDNLDEVLVGTPLRYRLLIKNTSPLDMTYFAQQQ